LFLTVALWFIHPGRRRLIVWLLAVIASVLAGLSFVFASFVSTTSLTRMLEYYTQEIASTRYLFPILAGWSASMVTLLFRDPPPRAPGASDADSGHEFEI
jgi:hypothetical protein